jgi:hypothetical protein
VLMAVGCTAFGKEFVLHEYSKLTFSAIRPSTSETLLNPRVTVEGIRDEPEYVLVTQEFGLIADFMTSMNIDGPSAICPADLVLTWVADFSSNGALVTFAGNRDFARASDGSCRKLDSFGVEKVLN